ncbi:MAG: hypothetical protein ACJ8F7_15445 [Gemmataceae bacterium]
MSRLFVRAQGLVQTAVIAAATCGCGKNEGQPNTALQKPDVPPGERGPGKGPMKPPT